MCCFKGNWLNNVTCLKEVTLLPWWKSMCLPTTTPPLSGHSYNARCSGTKTIQVNVYQTLQGKWMDFGGSSKHCKYFIFIMKHASLNSKMQVFFPYAFIKSKSPTKSVLNCNIIRTHKKNLGRKKRQKQAFRKEITYEVL